MSLHHGLDYLQLVPTMIEAIDSIAPLESLSHHRMHPANVR